MNISAPDATVANPLVLTFRIDASQIPPNEDHTTIQIFKDGVQVADCTGAPQAIPDPCISHRKTLADSDVEITVLTSSASAWNFGIDLEPEATATPTPIFTPTETRTPTPTGTATPTATPGEVVCADVTGNGMVNIFDILSIALRLGSDDPKFDLDGNGRVTVFDVLAAGSQFGQSCTR